MAGGRVQQRYRWYSKMCEFYSKGVVSKRGKGASGVGVAWRNSPPLTARSEDVQHQCYLEMFFSKELGYSRATLDTTPLRRLHRQKTCYTNITLKYLIFTPGGGFWMEAATVGVCSRAQHPCTDCTGGGRKTPVFL